MTERLLSTIELARRLNCGRDRIGELVRAGRIPYVMVGCLRRFDYAEVIKALSVPVRQGSSTAQELADQAAEGRGHRVRRRRARGSNGTFATASSAPSNPSSRTE